MDKSNCDLAIWRMTLTNPSVLIDGFGVLSVEPVDLYNGE